MFFSSCYRSNLRKPNCRLWFVRYWHDLVQYSLWIKVHNVYQHIKHHFPFIYQPCRQILQLFCAADLTIFFPESNFNQEERGSSKCIFGVTAFRRSGEFFMPYTFARAWLHSAKNVNCTSLGTLGRHLPLSFAGIFRIFLHILPCFKSIFVHETRQQRPHGAAYFWLLQLRLLLDFIGFWYPFHVLLIYKTKNMPCFCP